MKDFVIHELFEEQTQKTPDNIAAVFEDRQLTYIELNQKANRLAHYLRDLGVESGTLVGICIERSLEMIIGIMGILKAGGAYVPIDPNYPDERIKYILEDTNIPVLLTQNKFLDKLAETGSICLDTEWDRIQKKSNDDPTVQMKGSNLAYVIYTSGSTGKPKGVMIEHYQVINRISWMQNKYPIDEQGVILQKTTFTFDVSVWEMFWWGFQGARVVFLAPGREKDPRWIIDAIERNKVSTMHFVPSMLNILLEYIQQNLDNIAKIKSLKWVFASGEVLSEKQVNTFNKIIFKPNQTKLVNLYGPTEATVDVSYFDCWGDSDFRIIPIGKPVDNTELLILDEQNKKLPQGEVGELHIGGVQVARGYLNSPGITVEKFIESPFGEGRLYKTGDLARYLPNGNIEYLGRKDFQVKIRGNRIELGEIENVLLRTDYLSHTVVVADNLHSCEAVLIAYCVPKEKVKIDEIGKGRNSSGNWESFFDEAYGAPRDIQDRKFNTATYTSSYTGKPIPPKKMREWQGKTIQRIKDQAPQKVLEIGCGTGLIYFPLAESVKKYKGTDISKQAIKYLGESIDKKYKGKVILKHRPADKFDLEDRASFDTIICNSVTQYFTCIEYLVKVLDESVKSLTDTARIFLGDIRSKIHEKAFAQSLQFYRAPKDSSFERFGVLVQNQLDNEEELLIDPEFFIEYAVNHPDINGVKLELKQGKYRTEMNAYRYDVVLYKDIEIQNPYKDVELKWKNWNNGSIDLEKMKVYLEEESPEYLVIKNIPNKRLIDSTILDRFNPENKSQEFTDQIQKEIEKRKGEYIDPQDIWELEINSDYRVSLTWSKEKKECFDAVLSRKDGRIDYSIINTSSDDLSLREKPDWSKYSNNPTKVKLKQKLIAILRQELKKKLPDYMIPSHIIILDKMPFTSSGKVDRKKLPKPIIIRNRNDKYQIPETDTEKRLAKIWSDFLGVADIGIHDDFLGLGSNSLIAVKVVSQISKDFNVHLTVNSLFKHSTIFQLSRIIDNNNKESTKYGRITPQPRRECNVFPLSYPQQQMYLIYQMNPEGLMYIEPLTITIPHQVHPVILEQSLNELIRRYEILRTNYDILDGEPKQFIHPNRSIKLEFHDLSELSGPLKDGYSLIQNSKPFDISKDLLIRAGLVKRREDKYQLYLTTHHIIADGTAINTVFIPEIIKIYNAFSKGRSHQLKSLEIQYADYSVWQRENMEDIFERHLKYWKEQLGDDLSLLELPLNYSRPAVLCCKGKNKKVTIPKELTGKLRELSQKQGVTMFMTMLAVFETLLYRYTGQNNMIVNFTVANRNHPDTRDMMGYFVNTLPLKSNIAGNLSFSELLQEVKFSALEAQANSEVPFERIVNAVLPDKGADQNPFTQVMFNYDPIIEAFESEWTADYYDTPNNSSKFELSFSIDEQADVLRAIIEYKTDLFNEDTINRMFWHLERILQAVCDNADEKIAHLPILTQNEIQNFLKWNETEAIYPRDKCIHKVYEEQVEKKPDNTALVLEDKQLTYNELNQKANQLAHSLRGMGVESETCVGICIDRSLDMIIGIMGILKAGGAYLPIDPEYPKDRINYILEDTGTPVLLSRENIVENILDGSVKNVLLDIDREIFKQKDVSNPRTSVNSSNLAYVIYTSGSTGKPKGVMIEHKNVINLITYYLNKMGIMEDEKVLLFFNYCFDGSVEQINIPLFKGATLVLVSKETILDHVKFPRYLLKQKITILDLTPQMLEVMECKDDYYFKRIIVGGEKCSVGLANKWAAYYNLYNQYGPTETTITSLEFFLAKGTRFAGDNLPIGKAVENTILYILDDNLNRVPVGIPGELYIGGAGMSRGYLGRQELTKEKFIPNLFYNPEIHDNAYVTLYKTGDKTRYLPDGNMEFLGRIDHQVKIRGFRIELGEIETALSKHVKEAVVIDRTINNNKYLVAYLVKNKEISPDELNTILKQLIPYYMIPSFFVFLDKIPITRNGKIDRKALKALPEPETRGLAELYVAPTSETEKILAEIWSEVLGIDKVGIDDNFFKIGGDSIKVVLTSSRLLKHNLSVDINDFYINRTIRELARCVKKVERKILQDVVTGNVELTPIQMFFFRKHFNDKHHFHHIMTLTSAGKFDKESVEEVFTKIVEHHDVLRTVFKIDGDQVVQEIRGLDPKYKFKLEEIPSSLNEKEESANFMKVIREIVDDIVKNFDLTQSPLIKVALFKTSSGDVLKIIIHHTVVDGISWRILLEDFENGYRQFQKGEKIKFQDKTDSFKDWALKLKTYADSWDALKELDYWNRIEKMKIDPLPKNLKLKKGDNMIVNQQKVSMKLDKSNTNKLIKEVNKPYNTEINDILLTALVMTIKEWSGNEKVLINLEGHGREGIIEDIDISRTVGWFTSLYPVLLDIKQLPAGKPPGDEEDLGLCITKIKESLRRVPNKGIGYGILKYLTSSEKTDGVEFTLQPEICFNYLGQW